MIKEDFINKVKASLENTTDAKNRMGCSENWYNPYYAIGRTFTVTELENMDMDQLTNLHRLADNISDALY